MSAVSWPSASVYHEVIQTPGLCFSDEDLRRATPRLDRWGLPKVATGNFASVYCLESGSQRWAVRCFLGELADRAERYQAIGERLASVHLPCFAAFDYLSKGILCHGQWYPILKMDWVDGEHLDGFVRRHLRDPQGLNDLLAKWVQLMASLRDAQIAHGDLQHGNILVCSGRLKLVDYDGMWVPELSGQVSVEVGHANYQLPSRTVDSFGPWLDHFPAWLIYLSVAALIVMPELWQEFDGGDECLLFRRSDLEAPYSSRLWADVESCAEGRLRTLADTVREFVYLRPVEVPELDAGTLAALPAPIPAVTQGQSWISDHVAAGPLAPANIPATAWRPQEVGADWVTDHTILPVRPTRFAASFWVDRACVLVVALTIATLAALRVAPTALTLGVMWLAALVLLLTAGAVRYLRMPEVLGKRDLFARRNGARQEVQRLDQVLADMRHRVEQEVQGQADQARAIQARLRSSHDEERSAAETARRTSERRLAELSASRLALLTEQDKALARALVSLQKQHVNRRLSSASIAAARIPGVGDELKGRLILRAGIRTAADVETRRVRTVDGFGPARVAAVIGWRRSIEAAAMRSAPRSLSPDEEASIRASYTGLVQASTREADSVRQSAQEDQRRLAETCERQRRELHRQLQDVQKDLRAAQLAADQELAVHRRELQQAKWALAALARDLTAHRHITFARYLRHLLTFE